MSTHRAIHMDFYRHPDEEGIDRCTGCGGWILTSRPCLTCQKLAIKPSGTTA